MLESTGTMLSVVGWQFVEQRSSLLFMRLGVAEGCVFGVGAGTVRSVPLEFLSRGGERCRLEDAVVWAMVCPPLCFRSLLICVDGGVAFFKSCVD